MFGAAVSGGQEARGKALEGDWAVPELRVSRTRAGAVNAALVSYYQSSAFRDGLAQSSQQMRRAILERRDSIDRGSSARMTDENRSPGAIGGIGSGK
jgi:hypothetical protein